MSTSEPKSMQVGSLRSFEYAQLDVFAERPLEGNALAVFTDARGLTSEQMQAIARETNLSETTFILPRDPHLERERGIHVRIFLTTTEVPFAGHPTLGTASWLYLNHPALRGAPAITLDLGVGPITVRFTPPAPDEHGVSGVMQQNDPVFGGKNSTGDTTCDTGKDRQAIASSLGISPGDLDDAAPPQVVSTGLAFCIVPLRSLEAASRLRLNVAAARPYLDSIGARRFYCITRADPSSGADWHARMLFDNGEDPATGSAAGCAISWLVRHRLVASAQPTVIEQGIEMLRPSRLHVNASLAGDGVEKVFVGGRTIPVANGRLFLP